ncbi:MAG: hypothetical protein WCX65_01265 [bacterium]
MPTNNKPLIRFNRLNMSRFVLPLLLAAFAFVSFSCSQKQERKVDPNLLAAFVEADKTLEIARTSQNTGLNYGGNVSLALENLIRELGLQVSKYPNPRQASELKNLTMELAEIFAHSENVAQNTPGSSMASVCNEWTAFRPKLRPFVGKIVDSPPPAAPQ